MKDFFNAYCGKSTNQKHIIVESETELTTIEDVYNIKNNRELNEVLLNMNATEKTFNELCKKANEDMRYMLAANKNLPESALELLAEDNSDFVLSRVALRDDIPVHIIKKLYQTYINNDNNKFPTVLCAIAINKNTPVEILEELSRYSLNFEPTKRNYWEVRGNVARNKNTPIDILENLANDEHESVRQIASETLKNRGILISEAAFSNKNEDLNTLFNDFCDAYNFKSVKINGTRSLTTVGKIQDDFMILIKRPEPETGFKLFNKKIPLHIIVKEKGESSVLVNTEIKISSKMDIKKITEMINRRLSKVPGLKLKSYGSDINKDDEFNSAANNKNKSETTNNENKNVSKIVKMYNDNKSQTILQKLNKVLSKNSKDLTKFKEILIDNTKSEEERLQLLSNLLSAIKKLDDNDLNVLISAVDKIK